MIRIGNLEIDAPAVLAPMAGVTGLAYRRVVRELGCRMSYTEFVSADGLIREGKGSLALIQTAPWDHPLGVQIFGSDRDVIAEAARIVLERTNCDVLDLNMGCWVPKVIKRGAGAALLKNPAHAESIVRAVVDAVDVPVTAKIRAGWDSKDINAVEVSRALEAGGASAITLHARPRSQGHHGKADWSLIGKLKRSVKIPVMGNGGIKVAEDIGTMLDQTGCDAAMVGRAGLSNPWIFAQAQALAEGREALPPTGAQRLDMMKRLMRYQTDLIGDERGAVLGLRSQLCRFTAGFRGAAHFRRQLQIIDSIDSALSELAPLFEDDAQPDYDSEPHKIAKLATSA